MAVVLPPREGFSADAVGAIGLQVQLLAAPADLIIGQHAASFPDRRYRQAAPVLWPPGGRVGRYLRGALRAVADETPDLIEIHNRANLAMRAAAAFPRAAVVLVVHNDPQSMRGAKTAPDRRTILGCVTVVCVSHYLAARFAEGVAPGYAPPLVLHNAIDLAGLPPLLAPEVRDRTILFAGRVVADKGADSFVEACAAILPALPGWRAVMIGADRFTPDAPETPFLAALRPAAAGAGIAMRGYLPHAGILAAMSRAAIVCVPSRWPEPFGLTALEAMACGAALVCTRGGGLPEVAGDAALYAPPDAGGLADALLKLAADPHLRAHLSQAGQARARLFDAGAARAKWHALRGRLISQSPGAG